MLGIQRNLNWKDFLKSRESFLKKVSVCTLTDLNPGFDGPWKKLWIFFVNGTFIMPQKKSFGKKKFWISCMRSKVPFWQNEKIAKIALLNPWIKFKFFFSTVCDYTVLMFWLLTYCFGGNKIKTHKNSRLQKCLLRNWPFVSAEIGLHLLCCRHFWPWKYPVLLNQEGMNETGRNCFCITLLHLFLEWN